MKLLPLAIASGAAALGGVMAAPANATTAFDMEGVSTGYYQGSLVVNDGPVGLTVSVEGHPDAYVFVYDYHLPLLGTRSVQGSYTNPTSLDGFAPLRFSFDHVIDSITFNFGDGGGDDDGPVTIAAYDLEGTFLGSLSASYPADYGDGKTLTLNFAGASYFVGWSASVGNGGYNANSISWDISAYTYRPAETDAVPEPASWAMMIFGMFGVGALKRRSGASVKIATSY